jgi:hypothetical protein
MSSPCVPFFGSFLTAIERAKVGEAQCVFIFNPFSPVSARLSLVTLPCSLPVLKVRRPLFLILFIFFSRYDCIAAEAAQKHTIASKGHDSHSPSYLHVCSQCRQGTYVWTDHHLVPQADEFFRSKLPLMFDLSTSKSRNDIEELLSQKSQLIEPRDAGNAVQTSDILS